MTEPGVEYSDALWAAQLAEGGAGLSDDELIRLAGTVGISIDQFGQCLRSGRYLGWVANLTDLAATQGLALREEVLGTGQAYAELAAPVIEAVTSPDEPVA